MTRNAIRRIAAIIILVSYFIPWFGTDFESSIVGLYQQLFDNYEDNVNIIILGIEFAALAISSIYILIRPTKLPTVHALIFGLSILSLTIITFIIISTYTWDFTYENFPLGIIAFIIGFLLLYISMYFKEDLKDVKVNPKIGQNETPISNLSGQVTIVPPYQTVTPTQPSNEMPITNPVEYAPETNLEQYANPTSQNMNSSANSRIARRQSSYSEKQNPTTNPFTVPDAPKPEQLNKEDGLEPENDDYTEILYSSSQQREQAQPESTPETNTSWFCSNCGHPLKEGAAFCTNCGHPVKRPH